MFEVVHCDREDLGGFRGSLDQMLDGGMDGVHVRGVFGRSCMSAVASRLSAGLSDLVPRPFPGREQEAHPPTVIHRDLLTCPPDAIESYLGAVPQFRRGLRTLFEGYPDFESTILGVLGVLAGDAEVSVACTSDRRAFAPATIRTLTPGHDIFTHSGLDFLKGPTFEPIRGVVQASAQLSYLVVVQPPASGGELVLFDLRHGEQDEAGLVGGMPPGLAVAWRRSEVVELEPGDLLVFDGGRIYHRVSEVGPGRPRISMGGFVARAADRSRILVWN